MRLVNIFIGILRIMTEITWPDEFLPLLMRPRFVPIDVRSILDVGCGRGIIGALLRIYRDPERVIGIDSFRPSIDFVRKLGVYDEVIEQDITKAPIPFDDKSFDLVLCLEVIEHLEKKEGLKLLDELTRVGKRVIISTPGVYYQQQMYDGNPYQVHQSQYSVRELEKRGFEVYGVGSLKFAGKTIRYLSPALGKLTYLLPGLSSTLLAKKSS